MNGNSDCNTLTKSTTFDEAVKILETSIKNHKKPILIGVNHPKCSKNNKTKEYETVGSCCGNTPSITNHYVIANGIGYDSNVKKKFIKFLEVGTSNKTMAESENNKLYINANDISGNTDYNKTDNCGNNYIYKLTEVRKNDGYTY